MSTTVHCDRCKREILDEHFEACLGNARPTRAERDLLEWDLCRTCRDEVRGFIETRPTREPL